MNFTVNRGVTTMELIEVITSKENLNRAYKKVVENKGAGGIDEMTVAELGDYIRENKKTDILQLSERVCEISVFLFYVKYILTNVLYYN